ncbi:MAG: sigma-54-dependent Fis family transcriptional regulator [Gemmatimonadetes bacterium]|nr:sigma-54-dependent Fis family transcriptional regulator [Gemmatimonadota bacterium]
MARSILLIDDEPDVLRSLGRLFEREGWEVFRALTGEEGLRLYEASRPDLVLLDLYLPGMSGMDVLDVLVPRDATVIMLTGHGDIETAVEAMRLGAENFLTKPVELPHLLAAANRAMEKSELRRTNRLLAGRLAEGRDTSTLGSSPRMREMARQVELLAASDNTTVLLLGESGTGKGWVAQMLHAHSPRARAPFVEINCAGLSANFLDSELFGHEKGAFTDAKTMKRGLFEVAHGGTIFLDEIGDLAPDLQPKLLKVLERKTFRRLGGTREIEVDVRLVAATNKGLDAEVQGGRFREDLYYRLNVLPLTLPPLRERSRDDVLELVHRLLGGLRKQHPRGAAKLSSRALDLLLGYAWPGNVRELRNVLERALVLSMGEETILPEHLPAELRSPSSASSLPVREHQVVMSLEDMERKHIERTLVMLDGNRTQTAEALGISRATLHNKIRLYGLEAVGRD